MRELGLMGAKGDLGRRIFGQQNVLETLEQEDEISESADNGYLGSIISPSDIVDAIYSDDSQLQSAKMQWIADKISEASEEKNEWDWLTNGEEEEETPEEEMNELEKEDWSFLEEGSDLGELLGETEQKGFKITDVARNVGNANKTPSSDHFGIIPVADKGLNSKSVGRTYVDVKLDKDKWETDGSVIDEEELEQA